MICCLTCDVEIKALKNIEELIDIVSLINKYEACCTFFIEISHKNMKLYYDIGKIFENHEIGLHIHWGDMESYEKGLEMIPLETMQDELENGLELLNGMGYTPISFRGGGLCCNNVSLKLLKEYGFKIDSSVAAKLDEKNGWFQGHKDVSYKSWYYPSKQSYNIPALSPKDELGILEVPVTRMIPSFREWYPYTLTPASPFYKLIVYEHIIKSQKDFITLVTPIFHSWGEGKLRRENFQLFLNKLENLIKFLIHQHFKFIRLKDLPGTIR